MIKINNKMITKMKTINNSNITFSKLIHFNYWLMILKAKINCLLNKAKYYLKIGINYLKHFFHDFY